GDQEPQLRAQVARSMAASRAQLHPSQRPYHPSPRRRPPEGAVPDRRTRRDRDRRAQHHQKSPRPGRDHEPERPHVMTSPFRPLLLIANPNAGRGTVDKALPGIESVLADKNLSYRIVRTTHP